MDIATLIGILAGSGVIVGAILIGGNLGAFVDVPSIMVVFGGTAAATLIKFPMRDVIKSLKIGIGIAFVTWGTSYVPAAEVSLLVLLESVLGPIWVWLFANEAMTTPEMIGGAIVLVAVAAQAIVDQREAAIT